VGAVEDQNYYTLPWVWGAKPVEEFEPVLVVPGILGSWEKDGEWILDPITHIYDNLVDTLLANGYVEGETLFKFPYDWHQSNVTTAKLLVAKIGEIKDICDCLYVDLVTHSMGGLAASQYVASDTYGDDVDQILYLGTPLAGAPLAYKTWESGEVDFGDPRINLFMQRIFEREARDAGFNTVLDYIHGLVPSVQELLPIYTYLGTPPTTLPYPAGHPQNTFLYDLLVDFGDVFNGARLHAIVGNTGEASTTSAFIVQPSTQLPKWEHGEPVTTQFERGDGTVPEYSAIFMFPAEKEFLDTNHKQLASTSAPYVFEVLNHRQAEVIVGNLYNEFHADYKIILKKIAPSSGDFRLFVETARDFILQQNLLIQKVLIIALYSPIDVEITAPDGKRIGKDISTGAILNEIPDALYSGPDAEHEYVIILDPLPGEYKVKTVGTGSGSYTIATGYGDSATTSESLVSGTTTVDQIIENTLTVASTSTTVVIEEDTPPPSPPAEEVTPKTCVEDMQLAYTNGWIKKKKVYNALIADCKRLGVLFTVRDKAKSDFIQKGVTTAIKLTLNHMDKFAKDKGNTKEAVELITKNTTWFREHELD